MSRGRRFDEVMIVNPYDPHHPHRRTTMRFHGYAGPGYGAPGYGVPWGYAAYGHVPYGYAYAQPPDLGYGDPYGDAYGYYADPYAAYANEPYAGYDAYAEYAADPMEGWGDPYGAYAGPEVGYYAAPEMEGAYEAPYDYADDLGEYGGYADPADAMAGYDDGSEVSGYADPEAMAGYAADEIQGYGHPHRPGPHRPGPHRCACQGGLHGYTARRPAFNARCPGPDLGTPPDPFEGYTAPPVVSASCRVVDAPASHAQESEMFKPHW